MPEVLPYEGKAVIGDRIGLCLWILVKGKQPPLGGKLLQNGTRMPPSTEGYIHVSTCRIYR